LEVLGFALAAVIGLALGLLGGGGSILTVPVFVYVLGFAPKPAIAMSLPVVGATSLIGAIGHWRSGNVDLRIALLFGALAMAGSYAGARLAAYIPGSVQLALLGVVMLGAAASMLRGGRPPGGTPAGEAHRERAPLALLIAVGLAVGALTGIVGIGGGFLIVPALVILGRVPMKQAIGTSLLVIAMNSATGFLGYLGQVSVPWGFVGAFTLVAIVGIVAGTLLVRYVPAHALKRAFAIFLLAIGVLVLYQNRTAFARGSTRASHAPTSPDANLAAEPKPRIGSTR
jgi:uncharacterized membrane protein YfcA